VHFTDDDLAALDAAEEVEIETRDASGNGHRAVIWVVTDGGEVFVRSYRGTRGRWYQHALADPNLLVHVDGRTVRARAVPAPDLGSVERTSAALERKYDGARATPAMLAPAVLATPPRLVPA